MSINFPDSPVLDEIFTIGANSIDNGNNSNVYFSDAPGPSTGSMFMLFN